MPQILTTRSIFFHRETLVLFAVYASARILSFVMQNNKPAQAALVLGLLFTLGIIFYRRPDAAWMLVLGEIFLGGSGHLFEFYGLSLRTVLISFFLFLWIAFSLADSKLRHRIKIPNRFFYLFIPLLFFVLLADILGIIHGNEIKAVIQDTVPFFFLLLHIPAYHLLRDEQMRAFFIRLCAVFIVASAVFSLISFILFVSGAADLHGEYYDWFRNFVAGKITYASAFFYRIVSPEHLLITPLALVILSLLMRDEKHHHAWRVLFFSAALVMVLNFSRAYFLGFAAGLPLLIIKHRPLRWLKVSVSSIVLLAVIFFTVSFTASGGRSFGTGILFGRVGSIRDFARGAEETTEESAHTRLLLLAPITELIRQRPFFGHGLGTEFSYFNTTKKAFIKTRQFDWGYLEMLAEMGAMGAAVFLAVYAGVLARLILRLRSISHHEDFHVGLLAGLAAMLIINITTPAVFHVFGVLYLVFISIFITKNPSAFDEFIQTLYRIFNRLKQSSS